MKRSWDALTRNCGTVLRASTLVLGGVLLAGQAAHANFANGGFESGLGSWTVNSYLNSAGLAAVPPTSTSQLQLTPVASPNGLTIATSGADANTGGALTVPRSGFGAQSARVNGPTPNQRTSSISQTATMVASDVAPDGNIHMRFALAPVLQNPGHDNEEQPYFYVELTNVTKNTKLFTQFNFAGQPGVNWQSVIVAGETVQFTDWMTFDLPLSQAVVAVGDQLRLDVYAAGCVPTGHWGYVYVDQVSTSALPGLSVAATGTPAIVLNAALPYSTITYTYTYFNNSTDPAPNSVVTAVLPLTGNNIPTTFNAVTPPAGATCTAPAVGSTGTVTCSFGAPLAPGATGSFTITVNVPPTASTATPSNVVNHGNYNIQATGVSPLTGPLVVTNVYATGFVLDVSKTGSGQGAVASLPVGINCGTACTSANMTAAPNDQITLTASAAAGSTFTGWGGACSGNALNCVVTMSEARSVTANFESANAKPVPTLSQWALMLMAVLLGWLAVRQRAGQSRR